MTAARTFDPRPIAPMTPGSELNPVNSAGTAGHIT